jgi:hypothetical protein
MLRRTPANGLTCGVKPMLISNGTMRSWPLRKPLSALMDEDLEITAAPTGGEAGTRD